MDSAVLGMAIASMSGFGNAFSTDSGSTSVSGESFGEVLSSVSLKNPSDVVNSQPVKDMLAQMYGVQGGEENASLFDLLKAVGDIQLDDKAKEALSKLFEDMSSEDIDTEEWAGMSLDDSKKLLKIIDLMLYAASDKKPYGEKGVESIFDILFDDSDDEDKMSEMAAESGNVVGDAMFWQTMALSVTAKYTESNMNNGVSSEEITAGITNADAAVNVSVSETAENIPETEMIALPKTETGEMTEMPKTEFVERLTKLSEALKAEISEKIGDVSQSDIPREDGISQEDKEKLNVFAVKKVNVSIAAGEIEALTGAETAAPDVTEIADSGRFSNISAQIERVMKAEMAAVPEKNTVRELNIRLDPEELGEINVKLTTDGEKLTVAFTAENSSTAKLLSDNIRSLAAAIGRNDSETETTYLIQAADGSENAALDLSAGFADSFGRGEPQNNGGGHSVYRDNSPDTDDTAEEKILIQEAKLWQTV